MIFEEFNINFIEFYWRERALVDHEIKSGRFEERLLSLEKNNFALQGRIHSLERENERLTTSLENYKQAENSHAVRVQVEKVKEGVKKH